MAESCQGFLTEWSQAKGMEPAGEAPATENGDGGDGGEDLKKG